MSKKTHRLRARLNQANRSLSVLLHSAEQCRIELQRVEARLKTAEAKLRETPTVFTSRVRQLEDRFHVRGTYAMELTFNPYSCYLAWKEMGTGRFESTDRLVSDLAHMAADETMHCMTKFLQEQRAMT